MSKWINEQYASLPVFSDFELGLIGLVVIFYTSMPFFNIDELPTVVAIELRDEANGFGNYIDVEKVIRKVSAMNHFQLIEFSRMIRAYANSCKNNAGKSN